MANVSATMPDELTSSQLTLLVCAAAFVAATIVMCLACNWGAVALHKPSTCLWTDDASLDTGSANTVMFKTLSNCCVHLCCYGPAICGALGTSIALLIVGASASAESRRILIVIGISSLVLLCIVGLSAFVRRQRHVARAKAEQAKVKETKAKRTKEWVATHGAKMASNEAAEAEERGATMAGAPAAAAQDDTEEQGDGAESMGHI
jgi:hypothetical protein